RSGRGSAVAPKTVAAPSTTKAVADCPSASRAGSLAPAAGDVYFGVNLDWDRDSPAAFAARLGRSPAVYVAFAPFPLDVSAGGFIDGIVGGLVGRRAALMLTL